MRLISSNGVINLRVVIASILDMRVKFKLSKVNNTDFSVVSVLTVSHQIIGMVDDGVSDVLSLTPEHLRPVAQLDWSMSSNQF